jgi:hypothetical protein
MREAIPPLPNTPSWRGARLKKGTGTLPLPYLSGTITTDHLMTEESIHEMYCKYKVSNITAQAFIEICHTN